MRMRSEQLKWYTILIRSSLVAALLITVALYLIDQDNVMPLILCLLTINFYIGLKNIHERFVYLVFNFTLFTFIISRLFFEWVDGKNALAEYGSDITRSIYQILILSMLSITVGMFLKEKISSSTRLMPKKTLSEAEEVDPVYAQIVRFAFYSTFPFYFLTVLEKALFVSETSYIDYYISYQTSMPYLLTKLGETNILFTALLFCTEHRKKRLVLPIILFIVVSALSLFTGQRNILVLNTIMVSACLMYANRESIKNFGRRLYTRRTVILLLVLLPFLISFLYFWGLYRQSDVQVFDDISLMDGIENFFTAQGGQVVFLANTLEYEDQIWQQSIPYTCAAPYNYIRNLFGFIDYGLYTREYALYGNSLGVTQFYITSPGSLLAGKGSGGCYLSELYYDFGLWGIVVGNVVLGWILRSLKPDSSKKPWMNAFVFLMIRWIVYIPRASYFDWISSPFNIWNISGLVVVYLATMIMKSRGRAR